MPSANSVTTTNLQPGWPISSSTEAAQAMAPTKNPGQGDFHSPTDTPEAKLLKIEEISDSLALQ